MNIEADLVSKAQTMTQQERMSFFGRLIGLGQIRWHEYVYLVKQVPYKPKRDALDEKVAKISSNFSAG